MSLVQQLIPSPSVQQRKAALAAASLYLLSVGVTSVGDMGWGVFGSSEETWLDLEQVYDAAAAAGELAIRYAQFPLLLLHVSRVFQSSSCGRRVHCLSLCDGRGHWSWSKCMMQQLQLGSCPSGMHSSHYFCSMSAVCFREAAVADVCIALSFCAGTWHKNWSKCMMQQLQLGSRPSGMRCSHLFCSMSAVCIREAAVADVCIACHYVTAQSTRVGASA
jgi:hypothetical protein